MDPCGVITGPRIGFFIWLVFADNLDQCIAHFSVHKNHLFTMQVLIVEKGFCLEREESLTCVQL